MLARAGGVTVDPDVAVVTVKRGGSSGRIWLRDLYSNPRYDIALRPGDVILVEEDQRSFTALGALGGQTKVPLGSEEINAIEAIAMVGGLHSSLADPTGVFVLRNEPQAVATRVLGKSVYGDQRMAYVLDLTRPNGLFLARDFLIRAGDTVYVTEAPYVQWQRPSARSPAASPPRIRWPRWASDRPQPAAAGRAAAPVAAAFRLQRRLLPATAAAADSGTGRLAPVHRPARAGDAVAVWGAGPTAWRGRAIARQRGAKVVTVEDAFLRSVLPGRDRSRIGRRGPIGLLIDPLGLHFDPSSPR